MNNNIFLYKLTNNKLNEVKDKFTHQNILCGLNFFSDNNKKYDNFQRNFVDLIINNPLIIDYCKKPNSEYNELRIIGYLNNIKDIKTFHKYKNFLFRESELNSENYCDKLKILLNNYNCVDVNENIQFIYDNLVLNGNKYNNDGDTRYIYNLLIAQYLSNFNIKDSSISLFLEDINNFGVHKAISTFEKLIEDVQQNSYYYINSSFNMNILFLTSKNDVPQELIDETFRRYKYLEKNINFKNVEFKLYIGNSNKIIWSRVNPYSKMYDEMIRNNLELKKIDNDSVIKNYLDSINIDEGHKSNEITNVVLDIIKNRPKYNINLEFKKIVLFNDILRIHNSKINIVVNNQNPSEDLMKSIKKHGFNNIIQNLIQLDFEGIDEYKKYIKEKYYNEMDNFEKQLIENNDIDKLDKFHSFIYSGNNILIQTNKKKRKVY